MEKIEMKETKEQDNKIETKAIIVLVIRIIICACVFCFSIPLIIDSVYYTYNDWIGQYNIEPFNSQFETYFGDNRSYSDVRRLVDVVRMANRVSFENEKIKVKLICDELSGDDSHIDVVYLNHILSLIKPQKLYQVRFSYDNGLGYINEVMIREQLAKDDITVFPKDLYPDPPSNNKDVQEKSVQEKLVIHNVRDFWVGVLTSMLSCIILINSLIILIKKKYKKINLIIDLVYIVISAILAIPAILGASLLSIFYFIGIDSIGMFYSAFLVLMLICLILSFVKAIKSYNYFEKLTSFAKIIGNVIPFMIIPYIVIGFIYYFK